MLLKRLPRTATNFKQDFFSYLTLVFCMLLWRCSCWVLCEFNSPVLAKLSYMSFACWQGSTAVWWWGCFHCFLYKVMVTRSFWNCFLPLKLCWSIARQLKWQDAWFIWEWQPLLFSLHLSIVCTVLILITQYDTHIQLEEKNEKK